MIETINIFQSILKHEIDAILTGSPGLYGDCGITVDWEGEWYLASKPSERKGHGSDLATRYELELMAMGTFRINHTDGRSVFDSW